MRDRAATTDPAGRDRLVERMRRVGWVLGVSAVAATAAVSAVAASAFKGHSGKSTAAGTTARRAATTLRVPLPQHVPAITGAPILPPAAPPAQAQPQDQGQVPQQNSGGS